MPVEIPAADAGFFTYVVNGYPAEIYVAHEFLQTFGQRLFGKIAWQTASLPINS
jgi:hypothetical protein